MMKYSKEEKIDKLFRDAAEKSLDDLIKENPSLEELEGKYEFSDKHNKKMEKLFKRAKRIERGGNSDNWHTFRRISYNTAAVICMLFTVFTLVAFSVPEIRVAITNYIIEDKQEYIVINTTSNVYNGAIIDGVPKYIPAGYKIIDVIDEEITLNVFYERNGEYFISFSRNAGEVSINIDNESTDFKEIYIGQYQGYINEKEQNIAIIFHDGNYTYAISTNDTKEELILIAKSLIN